MAESWKGTSLEKHTIRLLAMLLQEDGTLTAERRHDCKRGICYSIGIQGHHICFRGKPLIYGGKPRVYCFWEDRDGDGRRETSPQKAFEQDFPLFASDWREQFKEYTLRMTRCIERGWTISACIQDWNSREIGRIAKVASHEPFVRSSLAL